MVVGANQKTLARCWECVTTLYRLWSAVLCYADSPKAVAKHQTCPAKLRDSTTHTHTHTSLHTHAHTHTQTNTHTRTHARTRTHTFTHGGCEATNKSLQQIPPHHRIRQHAHTQHTHTHTQAYTHTHTHTHTHAHTHAHTHTHIHTCLPTAVARHQTYPAKLQDLTMPLQLQHPKCNKKEQF
jgi:hypothetical protein